MQLIDIGDLTLSNADSSTQQRLFQAIREKIVSGLWPKMGKLPSTRKLAQALTLSRNTVIAVYDQLVAEGYIRSQPGSGFYVMVELPERYVPAPLSPMPVAHEIDEQQRNRAFATGIADLASFPHRKWQKLLQRHSTRPSLLGIQDIQGLAVLRSAIAGYLATSRSVHCQSNQIIITSGAQQALSIALMATLRQGETLLMEQPGYPQMRKALTLLALKEQTLPVHPFSGIDVSQVVKSAAQALYITPSNQYPMGTTLDVNQRLTLIDWANKAQRWIIEDDYDSEFQFAHRPYACMQGLASEMGKAEHIIYVGSFSKVMFNGLRIGYLVVPASLVPRCLSIKDALTGSSPIHTQLALADFISEGDLIRHIRKMRRLYHIKHQLMSEAIKRYFANSVQIISQPAGLHITLRWQHGINEQEFTAQALARGIQIRPMSFYEPQSPTERLWQAIVLGYGNVHTDDIAPKISQLAEIFHRY